MYCCVDGRYRHTLKKQKPNEPPSVILIVDPAGEVKVSGDNNSVRTESYNGWSAACLLWRDGELQMAWASESTEKRMWWQLLSAQLAGPRTVWIISWQCNRAWSLLGLWDMFASGLLLPTGRDRRHTSLPLSIGNGGGPGLLIAEDPPNICQLRFGSRPGQGMWIDIRNYGIDCDKPKQRGMSTVRWLVDTFRKVVDTTFKLFGTWPSLTVAATAYRGYRCRYYSGGIHCHAHPKVLDLEDAAYVGGRCEVFQMGELPYRAIQLDFRSHYGAIMAAEPLPCRLVGYSASPVTERAEVMAEHGKALATVTLQTDQPDYPYKHDGIIIYPVGRFTTTLCGPELKHAVEMGHVVRWYELAWYDLDMRLADYAKQVYLQRNEFDTWGDKLLSSYCKMLLNSLPGKMAQRIKRWETVIDARAPSLWGEWYQEGRNGELDRWRAMAGVCQREQLGGFMPDSVPAITCWINAHGRDRLRRMIDLFGKENVAYVDTDSLITRDVASIYYERANNADTKEAGALEHRNGPARAEIRGIKYYVIGGQTTCSGTAKGVSIQSDDGRARYYCPSPAGAARRRTRALPNMVELAYPPPPVYRHGIVTVTGKVVPIVCQ